MKKGARAQAAMEYIMIAGLILIVVVPTALVFYNYASDSAEQIDRAQIEKFGRDVVNTAESVYYLGPPSRIVLEERMPENVEGIYVEQDPVSGTYLFTMAVRTQDGLATFSYPTDVKLEGIFKAEDVNPGTKKVRLTAQRDSSGQPYVDIRFENWRRVFVTSTTYAADFGLEGADANCQSRAAAAGLGGTWVAWLSTEDIDAQDRVGSHRYVLVDNTTTIADNLDDLTDGTIQAAIEMTELGTTIALSSVWTGTLEDGTEMAGETCDDWTGTGVGLQGGSGHADSQWTNWWNTADCLQLRNLYCFEK